jgi:hypothetical protein
MSPKLESYLATELVDDENEEDTCLIYVLLTFIPELNEWKLDWFKANFRIYASLKDTGAEKELAELKGLLKGLGRPILCTCIREIISAGWGDKTTEISLQAVPLDSGVYETVLRENYKNPKKHFDLDKSVLDSLVRMYNSVGFVEDGKRHRGTVTMRSRLGIVLRHCEAFPPLRPEFSVASGTRSCRKRRRLS